MGKDYPFVRMAIIEGFLAIGTTCRRLFINGYTFYIRPRLFWEYMEYVYRDKMK